MVDGVYSVGQAIVYCLSKDIQPHMRHLRRAAEVFDFSLVVVGMSQRRNVAACAPAGTCASMGISMVAPVLFEGMRMERPPLVSHQAPLLASILPQHNAVFTGRDPARKVVSRRRKSDLDGDLLVAPPWAQKSFARAWSRATHPRVACTIHGRPPRSSQVSGIVFSVPFSRKLCWNSFSLSLICNGTRPVLIFCTAWCSSLSPHMCAITESCSGKRASQCLSKHDLYQPLAPRLTGHDDLFSANWPMVSASCSRPGSRLAPCGEHLFTAADPGRFFTTPPTDRPPLVAVKDHCLLMFFSRILGHRLCQ